MVEIKECVAKDRAGMVRGPGETWCGRTDAMKMKQTESTSDPGLLDRMICSTRGNGI